MSTVVKNYPTHHTSIRVEDRDQRSFMLYTGFIFFFVYEVLLFSTVHAWYLFTSTLTQGDTMPEDTIKNVSKTTSDTDKGILETDGYDSFSNVVVALCIIVVVGVLSFMFLQYIFPELQKRQLSTIREINKYIALQNRHSYGIHIEGA